MIKTSLADLEERFGRKEAFLIPWAVGLLAAVLPVAIVLLVGWTVELLTLTAHAATIPDRVVLGSSLILPRWVFELFASPFSMATFFIVCSVLLGIAQGLLSWWIYRWSLQLSLENEAAFRRALFSKYHELAASQGVSGQQSIQSDAVTHWIPQIRDGLLNWYRNIPRHPLLCLACLIPALLIQPIQAVFAVIAIIFLWRFFSNLDLTARLQRPILFDRSQSAQRRLEDLMQRGPLLAAVQPVQTNLGLFDTHLRSLYEAERKIGYSYLWKKPAITLMLTPAIGSFGWILTSRILDPKGTLNVSGALVIATLVSICALSLMRTTKSLARRSAAESAAKKLLAILDQSPITSPQPVTPLPPLTKSVSIEHVTLRDSNGGKMLEDVSLTIRPGQLSAILSTSAQDAQTLCELLLGFGTPIAGRVLWDNQLSSDFNQASIHERCVWIASDGPLMSGTIRENLTIHTLSTPAEDLVQSLSHANSYHPVFELPDNLNTLVSSGDDRFKGDTPFRLGIARAILAKPSLCVAYEPSDRVKPSTELETLHALLYLRSQNVALVVLAQRVSTLRAADQILVVHEHRIVDIGTHSELLERSDLYRHLNYTMFSPMRDLQIKSDRI